MYINDWKNARLLLSPKEDGSPTDEEAREQGFQRTIERYRDDTIGMAKDLFAENYKLRRKNDELTTLNAEMKGKIPTEGSTVLTPEQAMELAAYKALGTPDQVKTAVEERGSLQGKLDSMARQATLREIADTAGYVFDVLTDADLLTEQKAGRKLEYLFKELEDNGQKTKVPYVKDGDKETPLSDFAQENWANLLPSLVVKQEQSSSRGNGFSYPPQHQGTGGGNRPTSAKEQTEQTLSNVYHPKSRAQTK